METIERDVDLGFSLGLPESKAHHSLCQAIRYDAIHWLGFGSKVWWAAADVNYYSMKFDTEGVIRFVTAGGYSDENISWVSGGDGTTAYVKMTATYTAPESTTITELQLRPSYDSRTNLSLWSTEAVSQELSNGQNYTINWTLHADI